MTVSFLAIVSLLLIAQLLAVPCSAQINCYVCSTSNSETGFQSNTACLPSASSSLNECPEDSISSVNNTDCVNVQRGCKTCITQVTTLTVNIGSSFLGSSTPLTSYTRNCLPDSLTISNDCITGKDTDGPSSVCIYACSSNLCNYGGTASEINYGQASFVLTIFTVFVVKFADWALGEKNICWTETYSQAFIFY